MGAYPKLAAAALMATLSASVSWHTKVLADPCVHQAGDCEIVGTGCIECEESEMGPCSEICWYCSDYEHCQ